MLPKKIDGQDVYSVKKEVIKSKIVEWYQLHYIRTQLKFKQKKNLRKKKKNSLKSRQLVCAIYVGAVIIDSMIVLSIKKLELNHLNLQNALFANKKDIFPKTVLKVLMDCIPKEESVLFVDPNII